jgi:hypothetical protein
MKTYNLVLLGTALLFIIIAPIFLNSIFGFDRDIEKYENLQVENMTKSGQDHIESTIFLNKAMKQLVPLISIFSSALMVYYN